LEIEQKRVKLVDPSGMAVRVHAEKAVSVEEKAGVAGAYGKWLAQKLHVRTCFWLERTVKRGEKRGTMPHPRGEPEQRKIRRRWDDEGR
jgi:hypothetical protein